MTGRALWHKEGLEAVRTYKVLFLPVVFVLLAVGQPLTLHFMPDILDRAGLPEGTVIQIPVPPPEEVVASVFEVFDQMGVLIAVLAVMGVIRREIELGQTAYLLTLGITRRRYLLTKWVVLSAVVLGSVVLGVWGATWYTVQLFGALSWGQVTLAALCYGAYATFVVALTLAFSGALSSSWGAGVSAVAFVIALGVVSLVAPGTADWLPSSAAGAAREAVAGNALAAVMTGLLVTGAWIALALGAAHLVLRRREL